eukprot:COSAG01_NODE_20067_length_972_cov_5402.666667_1_plen_94_part_10
MSGKQVKGSSGTVGEKRPPECKKRKDEYLTGFKPPKPKEIADTRPCKRKKIENKYRELVKVAVSQNGLELECLSAEQGDREIVQLAVSQNGLAL